MLIAAVGLAGSGKTTALQFLAAIGVGVYFYVGGIVRAEVEARGLELNPINERNVREALRAQDGRAVLARRAAPCLGTRTAAGQTVLIDAICNTEESDFYRKAFADDVVVLGLDVPFEIRAARLATRTSRPMTRDELTVRDRYEIGDLQIGRVLSTADVTLANGGTLAALEEELRGLASTCFIRA